MMEPLAVKLRPTKVEDIFGQEHLVSKEGPIYNFIKNKRIFSMILYGNPGIGKTTIANVIVNNTDMKHRFLNATTNDKKDLVRVIEEAKMYNGIILVLDEIHRLNKDKQDILLPSLESGLVTLIGLTTSNPYYKINPAIRSRCTIFELKPLTTEDIVKALKKATKTSYLEGIKIKPKELEHIAKLSSNDYGFLTCCSK